MQLVVAHEGPQVHLLGRALQLLDFRLVLFVLLLLLLKAALPLLQEEGVVPAVELGFAVHDLDAALRDHVQEVAVVADGEHRALEVQQVVLQPLHRVQVQVVGGLVQQEDLGVLQDQPGEVEAGLFPAGKALKVLGAHLGADLEAVCHAVHGHVGLVTAQALKVGGEPVVLPEQRGVGFHFRGELLHPLADGVHMAEGVLQHVLGRPARRVDRELRNEPQALARRDADLALVVIEGARQDAEERGLAAAVRAEDADALAGFHLEAEPVEDVRADLKGLDQTGNSDVNHTQFPVPKSISVPRRTAACSTVFAIGTATESPPPPCSTKAMKA